MKKVLAILSLILTTTSCSNVPELETGEIKTLQLLQKVFQQSNRSKQFIDARDLLTREQVDAAKTPILFVELASGQNGTLTPYPGQGEGQTWLGADGATITTDRGILKASRGMGDDLMRSSSSMPHWSKINHNVITYSRQLSHITGNNKNFDRVFNCSISKESQTEVIVVWEIGFLVTKFTEICDHYGFEIRNIYYIDDQNIVRKSSQYHSETIGFINIERLER